MQIIDYLLVNCFIETVCAITAVILLCSLGVLLLHHRSYARVRAALCCIILCFFVLLFSFMSLHDEMISKEASEDNPSDNWTYIIVDQ